jgi:hypothetical protein
VYSSGDLEATPNNGLIECVGVGRHWMGFPQGELPARKCLCNSPGIDCALLGKRAGRYYNTYLAAAISGGLANSNASTIGR